LPNKKTSPDSSSKSSKKAPVAPANN
jgi:hypothetical protein